MESSGMEPGSPALAARFVFTVPPGKSHFEVFFFCMMYETAQSSFFGLCTSTNCCKDTIPFPSLNCFCLFVKNQPSIFVLGLFLYSLFCSIDLCVYPFGNNTRYWFRTLPSGRVISPNLLFFSKIVLAILGLVYFQINFRISLSMSASKNLTKILIKW